MVYPFPWPSPKPAAKKARTYQSSKISTAAVDELTIPLPMAGTITRVELDAAAITEFFKFADCTVRSPQSGGYAIRIADGQLLPSRDARLVVHQETHIQANSIAKAKFYYFTAGVRLYVCINIVEE